MDKNKRKEIYDYIRPGHGVYIIAAVLLVINILSMLIIGSGGIFFLWLIIAAMICGPSAYCELKVIDALSAEENKHNLDALYEDFASAKVLGDNNVHIGEKYIFGRRSGGYYEISDISKVYQYIHKTNFVEDKRILRAELGSGGTVALFGLHLKGQDDALLLDAISMIVAINPKVKVGYK